MSLLPIISTIRAEGITSMGGIAKALNDRNVPTPAGGQWHPMSVSRLLRRLEA